MNDRLDRLYELSDSHSTRAAHAESEAGRDFAELSGNHDALRYRERERDIWSRFVIHQPNTGAYSMKYVFPNPNSHNKRRRICECRFTRSY